MYPNFRLFIDHFESFFTPIHQQLQEVNAFGLGADVHRLLSWYTPLPGLG